jgi:hypothetical protein
VQFLLTDVISVRVTSSYYVLGFSSAVSIKAAIAVATCLSLQKTQTVHITMSFHCCFHQGSSCFCYMLKPSKLTAQFFDILNF